MAKKSKRYDYFDAFEKQAELALEEADLLADVVENFTTSEAIKEIMPKAHEIENKGDEIGHNTYTAIATDFITPIEREDIIMLSQFLDDILDYIEDVVQRFYIYDIQSMHKDAAEFVKIIQKSCQALVLVMEDFKDFKKSNHFKEQIININSYEEEADVLYMEIIRELHTQHRDDPLYVLVWTQLFARMEKVTDACEHAADTMRTIVLKNS